MSEIAVVDTETGELLTQPPNLFGTASPGDALMRAKEHADVLADVIKQRKLFVVISGKAYVYADAWAFLGSQVGVFPVEDGDAEPVEIDGVQGFKASCKAVTRNGEVVGRATAYCMRDEETWRTRKIHALASMAQTRAASKALKMPLGFIVQLAGYATTPAEEMPTEERPVRREVVKPENNRKATKEQHAKLAMVIKDLEERKPGEDWTAISRSLARDMFGVDSRAKLTVTQMHDLIAGMETADLPF